MPITGCLRSACKCSIFVAISKKVLGVTTNTLYYVAIAQIDHHYKPEGKGGGGGKCQCVPIPRTRRVEFLVQIDCLGWLLGGNLCVSGGSYSLDQFHRFERKQFCEEAGHNEKKVSFWLTCFSGFQSTIVQGGLEIFF